MIQRFNVSMIQRASIVYRQFASTFYGVVDVVCVCLVVCYFAVTWVFIKYCQVCCEITEPPKIYFGAPI